VTRGAITRAKATAAAAAAAAILIAALVVSCTPFTEEGAASGADGGPPGSGEAGAGASADAAAPADGATPDGGACLPPRPPLCDSPRVFAPSFDTSIGSNGFSAPITQNGVVRHAAEGHCGPGSLHSEVTLTASTAANAYVSHREAIAPTSLRLRYALRAPQVTTGGLYVLPGCEIAMRKSSAESNTAGSVQLQAYTNGLGVHATSTQGGVTKADLVATPVYTDKTVRWRVVDVTVVVSGLTATAAGSVDGVPFTLAPLTLPAVPTIVDLNCGVIYSDTGPGTYPADIDDVTFELCE